MLGWRNWMPNHDRAHLRCYFGGSERWVWAYSQCPDLRHMVEAGDQDAADVVVVESAVETGKGAGVNEEAARESG